MAIWHRGIDISICICIIHLKYSYRSISMTHPNRPFFCFYKTKEKQKYSAVTTNYKSKSHLSTCPQSDCIQYPWSRSTNRYHPYTHSRTTQAHTHTCWQKKTAEKGIATTGLLQPLNNNKIIENLPTIKLTYTPTRLIIIKKKSLRWEQTTILNAKR